MTNEVANNEAKGDASNDYANDVANEVADEAANDGNTWFTDHEEVTRKFRPGEVGYPMPEIVYWNLSQHQTGSSPVGASQAGVALLSGFSKSMLLAVMGGKEHEITPLMTLSDAITSTMYDKVVVVD